MRLTAMFGLAIGCVLVVVASECTSTPAVPSFSPIVGHLKVDGVAELVVLVDPQGRMDLVRGGKASHLIPGCRRDFGRQGPDVGEVDDTGDFVDFIFSNARGGRYALWIRPDSAATAQLSIELFSNATAAATYCGKAGDEQELEANRWYRADVLLGAITPADTCGFSLGNPIAAQPPKALRSL